MSESNEERLKQMRAEMDNQTFEEDSDVATALQSIVATSLEVSEEEQSDLEKQIEALNQSLQSATTIRTQTQEELRQLTELQRQVGPAKKIDTLLAKFPESELINLCKLYAAQSFLETAQGIKAPKAIFRIFSEITRRYELRGVKMQVKDLYLSVFLDGINKHLKKLEKLEDKK